MIIRAIQNNLINASVKLSGVIVNFNNGVATVDDEFGRSILSKYKEMIIDNNDFDPVSFKTKKQQIVKTSEEIRLENLLDLKYAECEGLKRQIENLKIDVENWKIQYELKNSEIEAARKLFPEQKNNDDSFNDNFPVLDDFVTIVSNSTFSKLKGICKDMKYPAKEWQKFTTKDEIRDYILQKAQ